MKVLVITKNNITKRKLSVNSLTNLLDKKNIKYQIVGFDEVDDFYDEIHEKRYKNSFSLLISYGGDGTILKSARVARKLKIPILGINVGNIGFLTTINNLNDASVALDNILKNKYLYEERSMLNIEVIRNNKKAFTSYAVNEATITTLNICKIGKYKIFVGKDKNLFTEYSADGLIIASPTGSTAHSLSAGGPIVSPDVNCFILTAVYPHTLNNRSIVIGDNKEIFVDIITNNQIVDIDGRISFKLEKEDIVKISKLKHTVKYIIFNNNNFLSNIRKKIKSI